MSSWRLVSSTRSFLHSPQENRGTIINISSIVAIAPESLDGVYGGRKAFLLAFSQSLKHELTGSAIRIQAVLPGGTKTNFVNIAGTPLDTMSKERRQQMMSTEDLVDNALAGLDVGESHAFSTSSAGRSGAVRHRGNNLGWTIKLRRGANLLPRDPI